MIKIQHIDRNAREKKRLGKDGKEGGDERKGGGEGGRKKKAALLTLGH